MTISLLDTIVFGNSLLTWLISLLIFVVILVALLLVRRLIGGRLGAYSERNGVRFGISAARLVRQTWFGFIFVSSVYLASLILRLPDGLVGLLQVSMVVVFLVQIGMWASSLLGLLIAQRKAERLADEAGSVTTLNAVELIGKVAIWTLVLLLALDNIPGVQVTALIASLGVGGIAVGLAVQNILGDLFASLSIALDKPFVIGDHINVGEFSGTVEYIGLKSTRLRSITGEQVIFSNSDLLASRIRNYKRMSRRRITFPLHVTYETPVEKLRLIPEILRQVITAQENATFDRAHFKAFGDYFLEFEVVFFVENPEYMAYMDVRQAINLALFDCFTQEGIEFAYPVQRILMEKPV
jgi:small-conductance mechanosensitive channel